MFKSAYTEHKALELYCKWVWNPKFREIGKQLASKIHSKFKGAKIVVFAPGVAPGSFSLPIMFGLAEELRGNELVLIGVDKSDIGLCFVRKLLEEQAYLSDLLARNTWKEETIQKIFEEIDENSQFPKGRHTINKRSYLPFTVHLYKADLDGTSTLYKDDDNAGLTWQEIIKNEMTPEAFHLILAPFVFHHLADWRKGVINSLSCLKTGGFFLFMEARGDAAVLENDLIETEAASGEAEEKGRPFVRFWREFWEERRQLGQDEWKEITAVDHSTLKHFILDFKEYFKEHRYSNGCFRQIRYTKCWKLRDMINCVAVGMFDTFRRMEAVYEKRSQIARKLEKKFESLEKEFDSDPTKLRWDVHLIEKVKSVEPNKKQHYGTLGSFKNMLDFYSYDPSIYKTKICDMLSYFIRQLIGHDEVRVHFKLWSILLNDWIQSSTAIQSSAYTLDCETLDVPDDLRPKFPDKSAENRLFSLQLESHQIDADQRLSIQTLLKSFTENEEFLLRKRLCESEAQLAKYIPSPFSRAYIEESLRQLAKAFHMLHALPSNHIAGALQFTEELGENVLTYMEYFCNPEEYAFGDKKRKLQSLFAGMADYVAYLRKNQDFSNTKFLFTNLIGKINNIIFFTYTRKNTTKYSQGCIRDRIIETGLIEINFDLLGQETTREPLINLSHYFRPPVFVDEAFTKEVLPGKDEKPRIEVDTANISHPGVVDEVQEVQSKHENLAGVLTSFMQIPTWKIVVCIPAITKIKGKYEGFGVLFLFLKTPISLLWLKALYRMVNAFYASLNTWVWAEKQVGIEWQKLNVRLAHNMRNQLNVLGYYINVTKQGESLSRKFKEIVTLNELLLSIAQEGPERYSQKCKEKTKSVVLENAVVSELYDQLLYFLFSKDRPGARSILRKNIPQIWDF